MRADKHNENSNSFGQGFVSELGAAKKILTFGGSTAEAVLDSATTAYADNDIIAYAGELDVTVPDGYNAASKILIEKIVYCCSTAAGATFVGNISAGTAAGEALNGAATGQVELFGAGATYRNANLAADLSTANATSGYSQLAAHHAETYLGNGARNGTATVRGSWTLTGLTAGTSYEYWAAFKSDTTTGTPTINWGGTTHRYPDFIMKATALPATIIT